MACCDPKNREILLTAVGNPNVDKYVEVEDVSIFEKYNLSVNSHNPVSPEIFRTIEEDIKRSAYKIKLSPGGVSQNTLRIFQWLNTSKFESVMIGSVGADEEAKFLERELKNSGVVTKYTQLNDYITSTVLILVYKNNRCAVYDRSTGASNILTLDHFRKNEDALNSIKNSKIVLLEGFFTVHSPDVGIAVTEICSSHNIITSFNLSGEYVAKSDTDAIIPFVKTCTIVVGNKAEFLVLCRLMRIPTDDLRVALTAVYKIMLAQNPVADYKLKMMNKYKKMLVITNGDEPLYCVIGSSVSDVIEYAVPVVDQSRIKDTTGAGDSFLAGFLYGLLNNLPVMKCLELGCKTAAEIIQQYGCMAPNNSPSVVLGS